MTKLAVEYISMFGVCYEYGVFHWFHEILTGQLISVRRMHRRLCMCMNEFHE